MEWDISERSRKCAVCKCEFKYGDHYYTALFLDEAKLRQMFPDIVLTKNDEENKQDNPFRQSAFRIELCTPCWTEKMKEPGYDCDWQGDILKVRDEKKFSSRLNKAEVFELFKKMHAQAGEIPEGDEKVEKWGIIFFLAIMLERKNILLQKKNVPLPPSEDGSTQVRSVIYSEPKTQTEYVIPYPLLSNEVMEKYKQKIIELLDNSQ